MELRQLRYFVAVAEELHFTRAAARLRMAQPPLSQQIRKLEAELGTPLLARTQRSVRLTKAGEVFLEQARRTLDAAERARRSVSQASRGEVGRLVVGFVASAAHELLPRVLRAYRVQAPEVELVLRELTTAEQISAVIGGRIDVGFVRTRLADDRLGLEPLLREPLQAALPSRHRLAKRRIVALRDLADESFVLAPRAQVASYLDVVLEACAAAGFVPHVTQEASESMTILGLVAAGVGVSLIPSSLHRLRVPGVVLRPLRAPAPAVEMAIVWRRESTDPLVSGFVSVARSGARASRSA